MPAQRLTMRRVRELLRLHYGVQASARAIARELGVSRSTINLNTAVEGWQTWRIGSDARA